MHKSSKPRFRTHAAIKPAIPKQLVAGLAVVLAMRSLLSAHEGHAPLPTKGAQVDVEKGIVTLSPEARKSLGVESAEVALQSIEQSVLAYATVSLSWQQHQLITTPIAGRIARLLAKPGELVDSGQELAAIEGTELVNLQVELLDASNRAALASATLARVEGLARSQVVSGRDMSEAAAAMRESDVALEIARSKLRRLRLTDEQIDQVVKTKQPLRSLPILSPLGGVVVHSDLALGKVVDPAEHLFEVIDLSSVAIRIDVLERDLGRVAVGQRVTLKFAAFPQAAFEGKISAKEAYLDAETHLGRAWLTLPNPSVGPKPRLSPGMYGEARIVVSAPEKKPTVPKDALLTNGTEQFVLVEEAATARASEYRKRNVVVGATDSQLASIAAGDVYPGDRVVTTGGHEMANFFVQGVLRLTPESRKNLGVVTQPVKEEYMDEVLEVDGAVDLPPDQRAVAASQSSGVIQSILVERGQAVRAGDVVAELSSSELLETQYQLLQSDVQLGLVTLTLTRLGQNNDNQVVAQKRLLELESQQQAAALRRDSARQRLYAFGLSGAQVDEVLASRRLVERLPVRAPIDGVIVNFEKSLGQLIQADEPLFEIHDLSRIIVRAHLSERDLPKAGVGAPARVRVVSAPTFVGEGKVVRSSNVVDEKTRTAAVWIELAQPQKATLYHDMLARVTFVVERHGPVLAVPKAALVSEGTRGFLFVEDEKGEFARRTVSLGRADDRLVQITAGLSVGERVAVDGAANLQTAYASLK